MAPLGWLSVIDVGHGNAAVLKSDDWAVVIDAGPGSSLLQFLIDQGVTRIDDVLISHADEDHLGGLIGVLASGRFRVGRVRLNSDAAKDSKVWRDLLIVLDDAERQGQIDFRPSLTSSDNGQFDHGKVQIEVLAPTSFLAARGPGSTDRRGRRISTNSISAVIRVSVEGQRLVLFAGDIDEVGLDELEHVGITDLSASVLVFPHHGGRSGGLGSDAAVFATLMCERVNPKYVVFSTGRGVHQTPNPLVVAAVRRFGGGVRVACTELSEHCAAAVPAAAPQHLTAMFARGRERRHCCAGTLLIDFESGGAISPDEVAHADFIRANAPSALCRKP